MRGVPPDEFIRMLLSGEFMEIEDRLGSSSATIAEWRSLNRDLFTRSLVLQTTVAKELLADWRITRTTSIVEICRNIDVSIYFRIYDIVQEVFQLLIVENRVCQIKDAFANDLGIQVRRRLLRQLCDFSLAGHDTRDAAMLDLRRDIVGDWLVDEADQDSEFAVPYILNLTSSGRIDPRHLRDLTDSAISSPLWMKSLFSIIGSERLMQRRLDLILDQASERRLISLVDEVRECGKSLGWREVEGSPMIMQHDKTKRSLRLDLVAFATRVTETEEPISIGALEASLELYSGESARSSTDLQIEQLMSDSADFLRGASQ